MVIDKLELTEREIEIFLTYLFEMEDSATALRSLEEKVEFYTRKLFQDKMAKQQRENAQARNQYDKSNDGMTYEQAKTWFIPFGKYKNQLISEVHATDPSYIDYIYDKYTLTEKLKLAIELVCYVKHD